MINFIIGRAGTGKSTAVCRAAADALMDGRRVIMLVPEQTALDTEERMTAMLGDAPSLSLEILNFRRLCNRVFREYGGISYNYITKSGRMLMMWQTLSELMPMLRCHTAVDKNTVSAMLGAISEFKAYNVTPRALERAGEKLATEGTNAKLSDKLSDLSLIYASYTNLVSQTLDDAADDLTKAAELLKSNDFFEGTDVFFDAFHGFTPQEFSIVEEIFKGAKNVTVSLCVDESNELFENQRTCLNKLKHLADSAAKEVNITNLTENIRTDIPELKFIEKHLWTLDLTKDGAFCGDAPALSLIECTSRFAECEAVALDILRRVRGGAEWRNFTVTTRGIDAYDGILDVTLEKYGIPHFSSHRTDIKTKPLIKLILSSLTLGATNFRTADVISYIKTGLCGITPDEVSEFENYVETWGVRGKSRYSEDFTMNPAGYTSQFTEKSAEILDRVNAIRERVITPLLDFHAALESADTVPEYSRALYEYLCALSIPETLSRLANGKKKTSPDEAQEYEQLWSVLIDALDELCAVMPEVSVDTKTYTELLTIIFDQTDIGRIPVSVDEVISGDASLIRNTSKHVYIIGANEGVFPMAPSDNGFFCERERETLFSLGIELAGGCEYQSYDERFTFYRAICSASETVSVIWSRCDLSGAAMKPSFAVSRLLALFPNKKPLDFAKAPIEYRLEGRRNILDCIAESVGTPLGAALSEYISSDDDLAQRATKLSAPLSENNDRLSKESAKELFGGDLALTQSRLDTYVLCHLSYFCKYILKLDEKKSAKFSAADIGTFVHHILEVFVKRATETGTISNLTDEDIDSMVDEIIAEYMKSVCRIAPDLSGSRLASLFSRLRRSSRLLCKNLAAEFSQSKFTPAFFELPIRFPTPDEQAIEPFSVELSDGKRAYIYGIVDRVDTLNEDGKCYVRVVDYKTGSKAFSLQNVEMGLDTQMLLYLFSLWKNGKSPNSAMNIPEESEIVPAGILYFSAGVDTLTLDAKASPEEVEKMVSAAITRKGLLLDDIGVLRAMDANLAGEFIPVKVNKDGTLGKSSVRTTLDEFEGLLKSIKQTIASIGDEIKAGNASAKPIIDKKNNACKYCKMRPICRKQKSGGDE